MREISLRLHSMLCVSGEISGYSKSSGGFSQDSDVKKQGNHSVWDEDWKKD